MNKIIWMTFMLAAAAGILSAEEKKNPGQQDGPALSSPRFTVQANTNCVLDNLTGLTWARNASLAGTNQMTWAEAVAFCKNLDYAGLSGWRLPTFKEFFSLMDKRFKDPALSNAAGTERWKESDPFKGVKTYLNGVCYYWVTTTTAGEPGGPWLVSARSSTLNISSESENGRGYVWPVRDGK
ncbi:MAG: DUF1566 domain-containing protein [Kiritimatiellia bacterium]